MGNKKIIKTLIWKSVESYDDLEDLEEDPDDRASLILSKKNSDRIRKASILSPIELSCEIDEKNDKNNNLSKSINDDKSSINSSIIEVKNKNDKKELNINFDEYMNIKIDLTDLPFEKDKEEDITFAISGKTFEILYNLNERYEILKNENENKKKLKPKIISQNFMKLLD